jgi:hypothetical protein
MDHHNINNHTLEAMLDAEYLTSDLKELAALICPKVPSRKDERIQAIVQTLFADLQGIFDKLQPLGQHAVSETVHTWNGTLEFRMFVNKYGSSPWTQTGERYTRKKELLDLFLIRGRMASDLLNKLKLVVPKPSEDVISYTENNAVLDEGLTVRETARAALANLATFLTLADDKQIRVSAKTGKATEATVRKMTGLLYEPDWYDDPEIGPMQPFAWPLLLQGGGLAKADGSLLKLTPAGRKALKKDLAGGIHTAWQRWEKTKIFDEFSRVTAIKGQKSSRGRTMTTPVKRRPMINYLLEDLQPGQWISMDEFIRLLQTRAEYSFEMVNYEWKLYFSDQQYGHLSYNDTWPLLQLRYVLIYLFEYCATLGVIDIAYQDPRGARSEDYRSCWGTDELEYLSHCDGLQYIRINDLGAFVLDLCDEYEAQKSDDNIFTFVETDMVANDTATVPPGLEVYLEKIGERTEVDRWRLTVASLLTAINGGESISEIKKTLEALSAEDFSKELTTLFTEVEHRSTAFINVGQTTLIECGPEARKQALTNKNLSSLCMPAGDKYLVAAPGKDLKFIKALESAGFILGVK